MFARINFLLGFGVLVLLTFYFAAAYLLIPALSAIAPEWAKPAAGVAILAAVGLTVQLLSTALTGLRGIALYKKGEKPSLSAYASQAIMLLSHAAVACALGSLLYGKPVGDAQLIAIAAAYLVGTGLAIHEWRRRMPARV